MPRYPEVLFWCKMRDMGIKIENAQKIRALEEELSDERIADVFHVENEDFYIKAMRARSARHILTRVIIVLVAIALLSLILLQFFSLRVITERSMEDTIAPKDCVVLMKKAADINFGDIIMMVSPVLSEEGEAPDIIKRVIGLPGDMIEIKNGSVFRNGQRLDEPYTKDKTTEGEMASARVPEGCFFVLGDNRQISIDSRDARIGYVRAEQILGKVSFRLLPVSRAGMLK